MAVRRAQDCGLGTGANVFLTKPALADLDRLLGTLVDLRLRMFYIAVAGFTPTARGRRYEALRPDLADLLPVAQRVLDESCLLREQWGSLESHTEAAWVRRAQDGSWPAAETAYCTSAYHQLVCRPNLDLHTGTTGIYRRRHGNLRRDGAQAVLERALVDGPTSQEQLYFPGPAPSICDLAALGGDADSTAIHFDAGSVRYSWLDRLDAGRNHGETASPRQGASATSSYVNSRRD